MDGRSVAVGRLAVAMGLIDERGLARAARLVPHFPGRPFERLLEDAGLIDGPARARLEAALAGGGAGAPPPARPGASAPPRAAGRRLSDSDLLPALGDDADDLALPPDDSVEARPLVVPDDEGGLDPNASDVSTDEDAIFAEPTMMLRDEPAPPPRGAARPQAHRAAPPPAPDEDAIFAEPTMMLRDEPAPPPRGAARPPAPRAAPPPARDEDAIFAEPTMMLRDEPLALRDDSGVMPALPRAGGAPASAQDEDAIFAEPTMMLRDAPGPDLALPPDEDAILAEPTLIVRDGPARPGAPAAPGKPESGAFDLRLQKDVSVSESTRTGRPGLVPGAKSRRGAGRLSREEFQRRLKMRQPFDGFEIGDYKILGEIARGAFGVVLEAEPGGNTKALARERGYEGRLALKVMLENKADPREAERFLDEVRVLTRFDHPHIVRMFDAGVEEGLTFYSMELIKGIETRTHVLKSGPMPPLLAVRLCKEVASALGYVHQQRTYHRDLKPQNVMLDQGHTPYIARLIDFGLVTEHRSDADKGMILGTPSYMPPEQAQPRGGHGEVNVTSDLYSLGATMYFLLTGQPPFGGRDPRAIIKAVVSDKPKDPVELNPQVPRSVAQIVLKCLEKKQRDRYHSAALLEADLERELKSGQMMLKAKSLLGKFLGRRSP